MTRMRLIERYLFRQLLWPTLAATLALCGVALLSETLKDLDLLVNQHQPLSVFLTLIALSLPEMLTLVLPIGLFVAALLAVNRLHTEQEIVVCFAGGASRWQVVTPAIKLATVCALVTLVVNLWVSPWCLRQTREELFRIKSDLVSTLVRDGEFTQPAQGLTLYAQKTDRQGELHNVFIDEEKPQGGSTAFTAKLGHIVKRGANPALILRDGSNQHFDAQGVLQYVTFEEYIFDLSPYIKSEEVVSYKDSDRYLHELLFPDLTQYWDRHDKKMFLAAANARIAASLYNIAFMAMALSGVLGGSFSRTGYGRRIAVVCAAAIVLRILGFGLQALAQAAPAMNVLQYAGPIGAAWLAFRQIFGGRTAALALLPSAGGLQPLSSGPASPLLGAQMRTPATP
jgi:lipopolysaccharide export system permease protein